MKCRISLSTELLCCLLIGSRFHFCLFAYPYGICPLFNLYFLWDGIGIYSGHICTNGSVCMVHGFTQCLRIGVINCLLSFPRASEVETP